MTIHRSAAPARAGEPGDVRVCTVLICDDRPELRDAIRLTLGATPRFAVIADAGDADSCLATILKTRPDLLILDVNMPGGGPHVAAAAKNIHPRLHILVFSGRADTAIQQAMLTAGADQFVLKTGRVRPLLDAMENAYQQITMSTAATEDPGGPDRAFPSHDEHLLDAPRCECGSPIMYRRRVLMGQRGRKTTFDAWCTTNAEHRLPAAIFREIAELRTGLGT